MKSLSEVFQKKLFWKKRETIMMEPILKKLLVSSAVGIYLLKGNNGNTRPVCETCLKLTINAETKSIMSSWCFNVNFE